MSTAQHDREVSMVRDGESFYGEFGREIGIFTIFHQLQKWYIAAKIYFYEHFRRF